MAALAFPQSPETNDIFVSGTRKWKWTGTRWAVIASPISPSRLSGEGAEIGDVLTFDGESYSPFPISGGVPTPPTTGTHTLKTINGVLTWVAD